MKYTPIPERFWPKVDKSGGPDACWLWTAYKNPNGYGAIGVGSSIKLAHRVSYELEVGPIPQGIHVCHRCDNPPCVNPAHLFLGTDLDNNQDMVRKGRARYVRPNNQAIGGRIGTAKLNPELVRSIRAAHASGVTCATIARSIGVAPPTIQLVIRRKRWAHVE